MCWARMDFLCSVTSNQNPFVVSSDRGNAELLRCSVPNAAFRTATAVRLFTSQKCGVLWFPCFTCCVANLFSLRSAYCCVCFRLCFGQPRQPRQPPRPPTTSTALSEVEQQRCCLLHFKRCVLSILSFYRFRHVSVSLSFGFRPPHGAYPLSTA